MLNHSWNRYRFYSHFTHEKTGTARPSDLPEVTEVTAERPGFNPSSRFKAQTSKHYSYGILTMRYVHSNDFQLWGMNSFSPHFTNEERKHFSKVINSGSLTLKSVFLTSSPYSSLKYLRTYKPWNISEALGNEDLQEVARAVDISRPFFFTLMMNIKIPQ